MPLACPQTGPNQIGAEQEGAIEPLSSRPTAPRGPQSRHWWCSSVASAGAQDSCAERPGVLPPERRAISARASPHGRTSPLGASSGYGALPLLEGYSRPLAGAPPLGGLFDPGDSTRGGLSSVHPCESLFATSPGSGTAWARGAAMLAGGIWRTAGGAGLTARGSRLTGGSGRTATEGAARTASAVAGLAARGSARGTGGGAVAGAAPAPRRFAGARGWGVAGAVAPGPGWVPLKWGGGTEAAGIWRITGGAALNVRSSRFTGGAGRSATGGAPRTPSADAGLGGRDSTRGAGVCGVSGGAPTVFGPRLAPSRGGGVPGAVTLAPAGWTPLKWGGVSGCGRSDRPWPNGGRGDTTVASAPRGAGTSRGGGTTLAAEARLPSSATGMIDEECGSRVATTGRATRSSDGRTPRLVVGTKLAGTGLTSRCPRTGWRPRTSTCATRLDATGPWPKRWCSTATTAFCTVVFR